MGWSVPVPVSGALWLVIVWLMSLGLWFIMRDCRESA